MSDTAVAALVIGDAAGIGPELAARLLAADVWAGTVPMVIGDRRLLEAGADHAGLKVALPDASAAVLAGERPAGPCLIDARNCDPAVVTPGQGSRATGAAALDNFARGLRACRAGQADFVCFTPFNKHAMRLADPGYVDEIGFIDRTIDAAESGREFNVLDEVWNARVTSHIPLRDVVGALSVERILEGLRLTDRIMRGAGVATPRIGVAAINPHAGDGGNFGAEDDEIVAPAVARAAREQIRATGPVPADTVFVRAVRGEFDAVLTMFHDQGQIAMKLLGFDRGVTLIANYPFPIVTPAHGTAYDIAGRGVADPGATLNALKLGRKLAGMIRAERMETRTRETA
ncbi:MAG: 4-hydroxythreonine-4-phosphate dehydrogenase PdxA [Rubrimonas sp.]